VHAVVKEHCFERLGVERVFIKAGVVPGGRPLFYGTGRTECEDEDEGHNGGTTPIPRPEPAEEERDSQAGKAAYDGQDKILDSPSQEKRGGEPTRESAGALDGVGCGQAMSLAVH